MLLKSFDLKIILEVRFIDDICWWFRCLMKFVHLDNAPGLTHLLKQKKNFTVSNSTIEHYNTLPFS